MTKGSTDMSEWKPSGHMQQSRCMHAASAVSRPLTVAQGGQVPVVDVGSIELDDGAQLLQQRCACRLDAQYVEHLRHHVAMQHGREGQSPADEYPQMMPTHVRCLVA